MPFTRDLDRSDAIDRRGFLRLAGYGALGLIAARTKLSAGLIDPTTVSRMEFDVRYRTQVYGLPKDAEDVHLWIPLPRSDHAQEIHDLSVTSAVPYELRTAKTYENRLVHVRTGRRPDSFAVEARYHVVRRQAASTPKSLDAQSAKKYLRLTQRVRVTEKVAAFTDEVVGKADRPMEIARKVYNAIIDLLAYDKRSPAVGPATRRG